MLVGLFGRSPTGRSRFIQGERKMSKPKINTIGTFSLLLAVGAIIPCHTQASDRAVIEVRGEPESEVMWFRPVHRSKLPAGRMPGETGRREVLEEFH
jgi:hypothetical protein